MKRHDEFEPMKLFAVIERLRGWADTMACVTSDLWQHKEDIKFLLASHLDYYQRYERWESMYWYRQDGWNHGGHAISWRERAEEMEAKLKKVESLVKEARWAEGMEQAESKLDEVLDVIES